MRQKSVKIRRYKMGFIGTVFDGLGIRVMLRWLVGVTLALFGGVVLFSGGVSAVEVGAEPVRVVGGVASPADVVENFGVELSQTSAQLGVMDWSYWEEVPGLTGELRLSAESDADEDGQGVVVIGDSLTVLSEEAVREYLPEAVVDAVSGTRFNTANVNGAGGIERLKEVLAEAEGVEVIVFAMGTNEGVTERDVEELLELAGGRRVILMSIYRPGAMVGAENASADYDVAASNAVIWKMAYLYPNVTVMDWAGLVELVEEYGEEMGVGPDGLMMEDELHPNEEGRVAFAELMQNAVREATQTKVVEEEAEGAWQAEVWLGLMVFGLVVVTAAVLSVAVGVARQRAWRKRERAQQQWQEGLAERRAVEGGEVVEVGDVAAEGLEVEDDGLETEAPDNSSEELDEDDGTEEFEEAFYVGMRAEEVEDELTEVFGEIEEVQREVGEPAVVTVERETITVVTEGADMDRSGDAEGGAENDEHDGGEAGDGGAEVADEDVVEGDNADVVADEVESAGVAEDDIEGSDVKSVARNEAEAVTKLPEKSAARRAKTRRARSRKKK